MLDYLAEIQRQTDRNAKAKAEADEKAMRLAAAYNDIVMAKQEQHKQERA